MDDAVFPRLADAPATLRALEGSCGPVTAWQVLTYLGYEVDAEELLRDACFDSDVGAYAVGLAVALAARGLRVFFHSDPDPAPSPVELDLYTSAESLGVTFKPGADLVTLDRELERQPMGQGVALLLYEANDEVPHFTPFLGLHDGEVVVPNEGDGIAISEMEMRRSAPGIYRQAIIAFKS